MIVIANIMFCGLAAAIFAKETVLKCYDTQNSQNHKLYSLPVVNVESANESFGNVDFSKK